MTADLQTLEQNLATAVGQALAVCHPPTLETQAIGKRPIEVVARAICRSQGRGQCICRMGQRCLAEALYGDYALAAVGALIGEGLLQR